MKKNILSRNIKKLRHFKNLNQSEFAALFELNRPSIGSYEEGRSEPKLATLIRIAQHFKLSLDELINTELTINQIARFNLDSKENPKEILSQDQRLEQIEKRLTSIESAIRLLVKNKK